MFIVDTHMHTTGRTDIPLPPPVVPHQAEVTQAAEDHLRAMDRAGVNAAWLICWSSRNGEDPSYEADASDRHPDRFVAGYAPDPMKPGAVEALERWLKRRVIGLRLFHRYPTPNFPEPVDVNHPRCRALIEVCRDAGVAVMIQTSHEHLPEIEGLFGDFSDVRFVLDHLASARAAAPLTPMARYPNLQVKFAPGVIAAHWPAGSGEAEAGQRDMMRELVSAFGAERLLWGTDYPNSHTLKLREMVDRAARILDFLSEEDLAKVMGGNALRHWKFEAPSG